jgi:hypothetical protein
MVAVFPPPTGPMTRTVHMKLRGSGGGCSRSSFSASAIAGPVRLRSAGMRDGMRIRSAVSSLYRADTFRFLGKTCGAAAPRYQKTQCFIGTVFSCIHINHFLASAIAGPVRLRSAGMRDGMQIRSAVFILWHTLKPFTNYQTLYQTSAYRHKKLHNLCAEIRKTIKNAKACYSFC